MTSLNIFGGTDESFLSCRKNLWFLLALCDYLEKFNWLKVLDVHKCTPFTINVFGLKKLFGQLKYCFLSSCIFSREKN